MVIATSEVKGVPLWSFCEPVCRQGNFLFGTRAGRVIASRLRRSGREGTDLRTAGRATARRSPPFYVAATVIV